MFTFACALVHLKIEKINSLKMDSEEEPNIRKYLIWKNMNKNEMNKIDGSKIL